MRAMLVAIFIAVFFRFDGVAVSTLLHRCLASPKSRLSRRRTAWPAQTKRDDLFAEMFEREINHRRGVKREHLRNQKSANNRHAERAAQFGARTHADGKRH